VLEAFLAVLGLVLATTADDEDNDAYPDCFGVRVGDDNRSRGDGDGR
jgi:hypothetical protein